jgi:hypothetical protein
LSTPAHTQVTQTVGRFLAQKTFKTKYHTNLIKQNYLMKTTLFIITSLVFFGIALYVYLRKEQDKFILKDKYDEAMDDVYRRRRTKSKSFSVSLETGLSESLLTLNFSNFLMLIITFFIASLISFLSTTISAWGPLFIVALIICLIFFPILPMLFALFPTGLMHIIQKTDSNYVIALAFGWLIYFVVIMLGSLAKSRSVFIFIYSVFIILLILNIVGCTQVALIELPIDHPFYTLP